jgi:hypothetical protein
MQLGGVALLRYRNISAVDVKLLKDTQSKRIGTYLKNPNLKIEFFIFFEKEGDYSSYLCSCQKRREL